MAVIRAPQKLLQWYDRNGRDLPWRKTRNPYRILISEIMLQQTQVDRVVLYYQRFLRAFPNWERLAEARTDTLIHAWAGLGYNRRALQLREIARQVTTHGVPKSYEKWLALKGIGPYTAAAVRVFAQGDTRMPFDTNTRRVLGRFFLGLPYPQPAHEKRINAHLDTWTQARRFADIPQALFDLASGICTKLPDCSRCPLRAQCKAAPKFLSGRVRIPKQMVKRATESRHANKRFPDRIYRGRILRLVRERRLVPIDEIGPMVDPQFSCVQDRAWIRAIVQRLIKDGFLEKHKTGRGADSVSLHRN